MPKLRFMAPAGVYLVSGSRPKLPISVTLAIPAIGLSPASSDDACQAPIGLGERDQLGYLPDRLAFERTDRDAQALRVAELAFGRCSRAPRRGPVDQPAGAERLDPILGHADGVPEIEP